MNEAYICDATRTPVGRYGGSLSSIRTDDLGALPIKALMDRNPGVDWAAADDLYYGCANQAGEDNRNVARISGLLAGLPETVPAVTLNRLCGSGMDAVGSAARTIRSGEAQLIIAGGVESMSRAPFVMPKFETAFSRAANIYDTTMGWRFVNRLFKAQYGIDSMPETAENVAGEFNINREDQDAFALGSQLKTERARQAGVFADEITAVSVPRRKQEDLVFEHDEHPRAGSTIEGLAKLPALFRENGTVTAGNASGINDGACALLIASAAAAKRHDLTPAARIVTMATAGVAPRVMGIGPVEASKKALELAGLQMDQMDVIELNEAFAAQSLACLRLLGLPDDAGHVNPNGGAIAIGHPLGMSGARLIATALYQLQRTRGRYALCTMCIGVGQGIAVIIERV
ncbi:MAG: 3-oxoadipyl-CoA thiolase [Xanthomonadales bacterium]|nr:3-oxoadipyl-CoA thiolase [Gammaproteobacteria bacterium]NNK04634.1 3-oxoadipyl-CoA thiolase [Xanthomonadales bacterium]